MLVALRAKKLTRRLQKTLSAPSYSRLLVLAGVFHLTLTLGILLAGQLKSFGGTIDNRGIAVFITPDAVAFLSDANDLAEVLRSSGIGAWYRTRSPVHVKLYSLSLAIAGRIGGITILAAEPLNLFYYLSILSLVFALGNEAFGRREGLWAAGAIAIWPSFLLHTTQVIRDPLFIVGFLALSLICVTWLTRVYSLGRAAIVGIGGGLIVVLLWLVRSDSWTLVFLIIVLAASFVVISQMMNRKVLVGNLIGICLLLLITVSMALIVKRPRKSAATNQGQVAGEQKNQSNVPVEVPRQKPAVSFRPLREIAIYRHRFIEQYQSSGSNIDTDVEFNSNGDIIRYLPRAMEIGFIAPFPNMWFGRGTQVRLAGRLFIGLEALGLYVIEFILFLTIWRKRYSLPTWLLFLIAVSGITALGLVVTNVGALYRMRYPYSILLIVCASKGVVELLPLRRLDRLRSERPVIIERKKVRKTSFSLLK